MGRMAERNHRRKLIVGKSYKITYRDRSTVKTERIVDIRERKGKYITAYCHLGKAARIFKRSRIKGIEPVLLSLGIQESPPRSQRHKMSIILYIVALTH